MTPNICLESSLLSNPSLFYFALSTLDLPDLNFNTEGVCSRSHYFGAVTLGTLFEIGVGVVSVVEENPAR
jgi:hypothetical protein